MNIGRHAMERYVERFMGLSAKGEIDKCIKEKSQEIEKEIREIFSRSNLIFTGNFGGGDLKVSHFYVTDRICMVVTADNNMTMKTMYPLDFPLPQTIQNSVIKSCIDEIKALQEDADSYFTNSSETKSSLLSEKETIDREISLLEDKIKLLKTRKQNLDNDIKYIDDCSKIKQNEINESAYRLFGNKYWRNDK